MDISIIFVAAKRYDVSSIMHTAFDQSNLQYNLEPKWATTDECLKLDRSKLRKNDVFVFEEFSGPTFEYLCDSKSVIIGTRCLLKCLSQTKELPPWPHPIFSLAMEGIIITASGINPNLREKLKQYVEWMGGIYDKELHQNTTHLVSDNVKTVKYSRAVSRIPVMHPKWIEAIWQASLQDTILGDCYDFLKESLVTYKLKPFHGLNITSASLPRDERDRVKQCVDNNGGKYMGNYKSDITDIVVLRQTGVTNAKYAAARSARKECVTPSWIFDSETSGYAIPMDNYRVKSDKVSTPTKADASTISLDNNFSMMSAIDRNEKQLTSVNESIFDVSRMTSLAVPSGHTISGDNACSQNELKKMINMKDVKNAGLFLDGCGIYLSGFSSGDKEILNRVLNSGGATRYDTPSERISHVIAALDDSPDIQIFQNKNLTPFFVNIKWLIESIQLKQPAHEDNFIINEHENKSTITNNKTTSARTLSESRIENVELANDQEMVMNMYKETSTTLGTTNSSTIKQYFYGRKFCFHSGLEADDELQMMIEDAGGTIVNKKSLTDYLLVPEMCNEQIKAPKSCQIATPLFIRACIENQEEVSMTYFFKPIIESTIKPLAGLVLVISGYTGHERYYISKLSVELGALSSEMLVRKSNPAKNLVAATHLICQKPEGKKYQACVDWGLPAVKAEWLLECQKKMIRANEEMYLIGDTKVPIRTPPTNDNMNSNNVSTNSSNKNVSKSIEKTKTDERKESSRNLESSIIKESLDSPQASTSVRVGDITPVNKNLSNLKLNSTSGKNLKRSREEETPETGNVTPINKNLAKMRLNSPANASQPTPVSKILKRLRNEQTPESPPIPPLPEYMRTPNSPYGAFLYGSNPSPETRKRWKRFVDKIPDPETPLPPKTPSPTWSEVKRKAWNALLQPWKPDEQQTKGTKLNFDDVEEEEPCENTTLDNKENNETIPQVRVNTQLQKLNQMLTGGLGGNVSNNKTLTPISRKPSLHNIDTINIGGAAKESQAESVGWRDPSEVELAKDSGNMSDTDLEEIQPFRRRPPRFLLSGVTEREEISKQIVALGGLVCEDSVNQYDPMCSHILCDRPGRSEKLLGGISCGKWVLSTAYITHCLQEGRFVNEEYFEWGNPNGQFGSDGSDPECNACYRWRCLLNNKPTENKTEGAFVGWKALFCVERPAPFARLIQAGFGETVDCSCIESLREGSVTHCFYQPRKNALDNDDIRHLTRIGAQVLPVQYLNKYLIDYPIPDAKEFLLTV